MDRWEKDGIWRRETAHNLKHTTSSLKHGGGYVKVWAYMVAKGTGSVVFICDVAADRSSRMNSGVFRAI